MAEVLGELGDAATGHRSLVVLRVDDLDAYCEQIAARGATLLHAPAAHDGPDAGRPPQGPGGQPGGASGVAAAARLRTAAGSSSQPSNSRSSESSPRSAASSTRARTTPGSCRLA